MNEQKQRLKLRLAEIRNCKTPEELAFAIWSKKFEEATGSNKDAYRKPFINWIEHFVGETENNLIWTSYKTPRDLAEGIWQPFLDEPNDEWFPSLRDELVAWIFNYSHEFYYASKRWEK